MSKGLGRDKVIVVLSESYKKKADESLGGVGIEYKSISCDMDKHPQKYILVSFDPLNDDVRAKITPILFISHEVIDLSEDSKNGYKKLFSKLRDIPLIVFSEVGSKLPEVITEKPTDFDTLMEAHSTRYRIGRDEKINEVDNSETSYSVKSPDVSEPLSINIAPLDAGSTNRNKAKAFLMHRSGPITAIVLLFVISVATIGYFLGPQPEPKDTIESENTILSEDIIWSDVTPYQYANRLNANRKNLVESENTFDSCYVLTTVGNAEITPAILEKGYITLHNIEPILEPKIELVANRVWTDFNEVSNSYAKCQYDIYLVNNGWGDAEEIPGYSIFYSSSIYDGESPVTSRPSSDQYFPNGETMRLWAVYALFPRGSGFLNDDFSDITDSITLSSTGLPLVIYDDNNTVRNETGSYDIDIVKKLNIDEIIENSQIDLGINSDIIKSNGIRLQIIPDKSCKMDFSVNYEINGKTYTSPKRYSFTAIVPYYLDSELQAIIDKITPTSVKNEVRMTIPVFPIPELEIEYYKNKAKNR